MKKFTLKNLDCANCAMKLETKLNALPNVRSAKVMFASNSLLIDADDIEAVKKAVHDHEESIVLIEGRCDNTEPAHNTKKELALLGIYILLFGIAAAWVTFFPQKPFVMGGYALLAVIYFTAGWNVISTAFKNIMKGQVFDENFLMTFATIAAFAIGAYTESVAVMLFYKTGEFFQELAVNRSRRSIKALLEVRPDRADIIKDGEVVTVSPEFAEIGDIAIVKPGEKIPLDGVVIKGSSYVDKRALTGESVPSGVKTGDDVFAGSINLSGLLEIRVTKLFAESSVSKILDLVENAASNKAKTENFITTFARYYTPAVFFVSFMIAVVPPLIGFGSFSEWIYRALVVLVVSCPCALVISVPLGYFGGIGAASKKGILVKGANYLEALADVKAAAFDKTGTLTKGAFKVTEISPRNGFTADDVLRYAAFAESRSNHPIARSIIEEYGKSAENHDVSEYEEMSGHGVKIVIGGRTYMAGNDRMLHKFNVEHNAAECSVEGGVAHIVVDNIYAGYIIISDELKDDTKEAIIALKAAGVERTAVLTGDNKFAAERILHGLGIDECYANLLPEDKAEAFRKFKNKTQNGKTIFVGDGINDAPVLAAADIGISMGAMGSDAAIETADAVIMNDSPMNIAEAIKIARKTKKIIWQNIIFALSVKSVFVVLGFLGIATMWEAVFGDIGVALLALFNSMRLVWGISTK